MFDRSVSNKMTTGWQCANPAIASFFFLNQAAICSAQHPKIAMLEPMERPPENMFQ